MQQQDKLSQFEKSQQLELPTETLAITISQDDQQIILSGFEFIYIYEIIEQQLKIQQSIKISQPSLTLAYSNNFFVSGHSQGYMNIWQKIENKYICQQETHQNYFSISSIICNQDGSLIIYGTNDGNLVLWKKNNQEQYIVYQTINQHKSGIISLSLSPSQKQLISIGYNEKLILWDINDQNVLIQNDLSFNQQDKISKACFINNSQICIQHFGIPKFSIFILNNNEQSQLFKTIDINTIQKGYDANYNFLIQFSQQTKLLLLKYLGIVSLFYIQNEIIELQQTFQEEYHHGIISHNSKYLILCHGNRTTLQLFLLKDNI